MCRRRPAAPPARARAARRSRRMHEVTSRPSATSPAQPPAGAVAPDRPSWRSLLLEGLLVHLVLQALTPRSWPTSSTGCCTRATCRSGCCPRRPPWRWSRPCTSPWPGLHVGVLPDRPARGVGRGRAGRPGLRVGVGEPPAHHLVEPAASDRLDAPGPGPGPGAPGPGVRAAPLCGVDRGRGRAAAVGRPSEEWVYTLFALATYGLAWVLAAAPRTWPRRLAARPAWEYATKAETISGRDGGLMPFRAYQEFFVAAVDPKAPPHRRVNLQAPSRWGWPALDLMGVRWFCESPGRGRGGSLSGFDVRHPA
jgi:hypothetical protein